MKQEQEREFEGGQWGGVQRGVSGCYVVGEGCGYGKRRERFCFRSEVGFYNPRRNWGSVETDRRKKAICDPSSQTEECRDPWAVDLHSLVCFRATRAGLGPQFSSSHHQPIAYLRSLLACIVQITHARAWPVRRRALRGSSAHWT